MAICNSLIIANYVNKNYVYKCVLELYGYVECVCECVCVCEYVCLHSVGIWGMYMNGNMFVYVNAYAHAK